MKDEIVIRIPYRLLRELLSSHDHANDVEPPVIEPARDERPWTDRQRRYLFRLAYQLGHKGEKAKAFICRRLNIPDTAAPTPGQASQLIDDLRGEVERHKSNGSADVSA